MGRCDAEQRAAGVGVFVVVFDIVSLVSGNETRIHSFKMAFQIKSHRELEEARDGVHICYLCGCRFRNIVNGKPSGYQVEHIIPRGLLRSLKSENYTPAMLWVHKECDSKYKQQFDNLSSVFQKLHLIDPNDWSEKMAVQAKPLFTKYITDDFGLKVPAVDGKPLLEACRKWISGYHTLLYGTFLPVRKDIFTVIPPTQAFPTGTRSRNSEIERHELSRSYHNQSQWWDFLNFAIEMSKENNATDIVSAWGGHSQYHAVWMNVGNDQCVDKNMRAMCFWTIDYPGLKELTEKISGEQRVWSGRYYYYSIPPNASRMTDFLPER